MERTVMEDGANGVVRDLVELGWGVKVKGGERKCTRFKYVVRVKECLFADHMICKQTEDAS